MIYLFFIFDTLTLVIDVITHQPLASNKTILFEDTIGNDRIRVKVRVTINNFRGHHPQINVIILLL